MSSLRLSKKNPLEHLLHLALPDPKHISHFLSQSEQIGVPPLGFFHFREGQVKSQILFGQVEHKGLELSISFLYFPLGHVGPHVVLFK